MEGIKKNKLFNKEIPDSELRYDLISHDWVVISPGRSKRPEAFKEKKHSKSKISKKDCPFCDIKTQLPPTLIVANGQYTPFGKNIPKNWSIVSVPNKYPAFSSSFNSDIKKDGPYISMSAYGFHEVVVFRNHKKQLWQFNVGEIKEILDVYQQRYFGMMNDSNVNYISIFNNYGAAAGASIFHPHSQIIATSVIDPDVNAGLMESQHYQEVHNQCISCAMNEWDIKDKKRVVFENEEFLAVCPFASKNAFEVVISPKKHMSYWERIGDEEKDYLAEALSAVLKKIRKGLNDPAYNFYLHTAPCDGTNYDYYHWHWVVVPKTSTLAGFEMGAGIEISTIAPETAAKYLRKQ